MVGARAPPRRKLQPTSRSHWPDAARSCPVRNSLSRCFSSVVNPGGPASVDSAWRTQLRHRLPMHPELFAHLVQASHQTGRGHHATRKRGGRRCRLSLGTRGYLRVVGLRILGLVILVESPRGSLSSHGLHPLSYPVESPFGTRGGSARAFGRTQGTLRCQHKECRRR